MTTRRHFLAGAAALAATARVAWADVGSPAYLAAARDAQGAFSLHALDAAGMPLFALPLPGRGHAAAGHPQRAEAVAFARRPGGFAVVLDCATGRAIAHLTPPEGRQFNGHGAFSADGAVLMTSEMVAETSAGRIGLWDATQGYARMGEWDSGGIGPHDVRRLADGRLVVANGGIRTDPGDRSKLNLDSMAPNLTILDAGGRIVDQTALGPDLAQNSIRHLALMPDGTIAFAMQWEGDPALPVPQLGLWRPGTAPLLCQPPETEALAMQGYAGSIAAAGGRVAVTSPRGGVVMIHDAGGAHLATHRRADLCGVAAAGDAFLVTDGLGGIGRATPEALSMTGTRPVAWDNHLIALT